MCRLGVTWVVPSVITQVYRPPQRCVIPNRYAAVEEVQANPVKVADVVGCRYGAAPSAPANGELMTTTVATTIVSSTARPPLPYPTLPRTLNQGYGLRNSNTR
jgi:hypothetical protein